MVYRARDWPSLHLQYLGGTGRGRRLKCLELTWATWQDSVPKPNRIERKEGRTRKKEGNGRGKREGEGEKLKHSREEVKTEGRE